MRIGVPAETRPGEARVAATPETVKKLVAGKHTVVVQSGAGTTASFPDEAYVAAGATIGSLPMRSVPTWCSRSACPSRRNSRR